MTNSGAVPELRSARWLFGWRFWQNGPGSWWGMCMFAHIISPSLYYHVRYLSWWQIRTRQCRALFRKIIRTIHHTIKTDGTGLSFVFDRYIFIPCAANHDTDQRTLSRRSATPNLCSAKPFAL